MESQTIVVVENTLLVRLSARVATRQYFTNLVVVAELREIFESLYMVGVVAKYTVEGGVAILQTTHVDRNDSYSRLEHLLILNQKTVSARYATNENINCLCKF